MALRVHLRHFQHGIADHLAVAVEHLADDRDVLAGRFTVGQNWRKQVFGNQAGNLGNLRKQASEGSLGAKNELGTLREKRQRLLAKSRQVKPGVGPGQAL